MQYESNYNRKIKDCNFCNIYLDLILININTLQT